MNQIICQAIKERDILTFFYDGYYRTVEPHAYGITTANNEALRCYQTAGTSRSGTVPGWHLMLIEKISSLVVVPEKFAGPRPGYQREDKDMPTIFCEL
jgi:hypothetical protein